MTFQRIVIALLVLIVAGLGAIGYVEWRMAVQVRTLKAFVEGYVAHLLGTLTHRLDGLRVAYTAPDYDMLLRAWQALIALGGIPT